MTPPHHRTCGFPHPAVEPCFLHRSDRSEVSEYHEEFYRVLLRYGFSESPNVFKDLCTALQDRTKIKPAGITFYQSREVLLTTGPGKMAAWQKKLFVTLSRLLRPATGYFDLPPRQGIEVGIQLEVKSGVPPLSSRVMGHG